MALVENNFGTVIVNNYGANVAPTVIDQIEAGASEEVLADIGYRTSEASPNAVAASHDTTDTPNSAEAIPMHAVSRDDRHHAILRRTYLLALAGERKLMSQARGYEGFLTNHEREPENRDRVEELLPKVLDEAAVTLRRACGHCALRSNCRIFKAPVEDEDVPKHEIVTEERATDITLNRWKKRHPYANHADNREQQSRQDFLAGLEEDPLYNCRPPRAKR